MKATPTPKPVAPAATTRSTTPAKRSATVTPATEGLITKVTPVVAETNEVSAVEAALLAS